MSSIFASSLPTEPLPASRLLEAVQKQKANLTHGMLEIDNIGGGSIGIVVFDKEEIAAYAHNPGGIAAIPSDGWKQVIPAASNSKHRLLTLQVVPGTLRMVHVRLAQPPESQMFHLPVDTLVENLTRWRENPKPVLLHIRWSNSDGLVIISGLKTPDIEVAIFANGQQIPDKTTLADIVEWSEPEYVLSIFNYVENQAWRIYLLQAAFSCLIEHLLKRYSEVTGRVLVNSVVRCFNLEAASQEWDISIVNDKIRDNITLANFDEAKTRYQTLMLRTLDQMGTLVGRNLVLLILKDVLSDIEEPCFRILQDNQIVPDAYYPLVTSRS